MNYCLAKLRGINFFPATSHEVVVGLQECSPQKKARFRTADGAGNQQLCILQLPCLLGAVRQESRPPVCL